jgi:hypothetical protein
MGGQEIEARVADAEHGLGAVRVPTPAGCDREEH